MAGLIITNTTPLINFAEIGRMDLLEALFGSLLIPPAVRRELEEKSALFPAAAKVPAIPWISVVPPRDALLAKGFSGSLHPGEAECLALALEHPGSLLIIDEIAAREIAASNDLLFTGTLGCLALAKQRRFLPAIKPVLQELREKARFWISDHLTARILRDAGEE